MTRVLLVGSGAREHAITRALCNSGGSVSCFASNLNPGIMALAAGFELGELDAPEAVVAFAAQQLAELAVIGPEAPLAAGVADALRAAGIPTVGPGRELAQIETSKAFARDLLMRHGIPGCPRYRTFDALAGVAGWLAELGDSYVVKYDGLAGGKGVKVAGDHLHSHADALAYCRELVACGGRFVVEEKLVGEEFSLMSFCDGETLRHMPAVQDHKRALEGDRGPNTGGMGSYCDANHSLAFLDDEDISAAQAINEATAAALKAECDEPYRGFLYGGFIATAGGSKLIEYNARLGDPEALNVLEILQSDFLPICEGMATGTLAECEVTFRPEATVCKYVVPEGYGAQPRRDCTLVIDDERLAASGVSLFYAAVNQPPGGALETTSSRAVAVVGSGATLAAAEAQCEAGLAAVSGRGLHVRHDIATPPLLAQRVAHMRQLRGKRVAPVAGAT
jgi:phosphoribosylamine--glycine ligase